MSNSNNQKIINDLNQSLKSDIDNNKLPIIEIILLKYGYGIKVWTIFIPVFFILMVEGIHLTFFGNLLIPIKNFYSLNDDQIKLYSSLIFIAVGLGSLSAGFLSNKFKRVNLIILSQTIISICHFLISLTENVIIFTILRLIIGLLLGIIVPISINLFAEFLPLKNRALILIFVWLGYVFGQCSLQIFMLLFMPNMETDNYLYTVRISSIIPYVSLFISIFMIRDSPRNMIFKKNYDDGLKILEELNREKLTDNQKIEIINDIKIMSDKKNNNLNIKDLFSPKILYLTIIMSFLWLLLANISYGPYLIYSLTMKDLDPKDLTNNQIIINQLIVNSLSAISNIAGGFISEFKFLGRRKGIILCCSLSMILMILIVTLRDHFELFFGLFNAFYGMCPNINVTYSSELFNTRIRDLALGYFFFLSRCGAFLSQIIYVSLYDVDTWVPYYFTIGLLFIIIIILFLLPIETYRKPLDYDCSNIKIKSNIIYYN